MNVPKVTPVCAALFLLATSSFTLLGQNVDNSNNLGKTEGKGSPFRALRSVSGASGHEENGHFVMDDARSVFTAGKDAKAIVYFEWRGPLGPHHFEGLWKSPEGKIVLISDFRYEAKTPNFSGYWSMLLADATPSGEWTLEARIDGEAAGFHNFVITGSPVSAATSPPARPFLSSSELYEAALQANVTIEKLAADGSLLGKSSGFWVADGQVLTSFESIDGASSLRLLVRDGKPQVTDQVVAWNRWQDWAVIKLQGQAKLPLKRSSKKLISVGDRCVFLEWATIGAKLVDGTITGKTTFPRAGDRLLVASGATSLSIGGPLLNEYGEYVGVVGGTIAPGGEPMKILGLMSDANTREEMETTALAVPFSYLPEPAESASLTTLGELARRGEFIPPVFKSKEMGHATLTSFVERDRNRMAFPKDYKQVFSRRDGKAQVYVNWRPETKQTIWCNLKIYNLENTVVSSSKPLKLSLAPGRFLESNWDIPVGNMTVGIYRVDLLVGDQAVWRDFLRVTE